MQRRILIVDDEAFNQVGLKMLMKTMKRFKGITKLIDTANDGQDCLKKIEAARQNNKTYCLVFMDLSMPVMDGYEATEALRDFYEG